jgi:hypothetical protein
MNIFDFTNDLKNGATGHCHTHNIESQHNVPDVKTADLNAAVRMNASAVTRQEAVGDTGYLVDALRSSNS